MEGIDRFRGRFIIEQIDDQPDHKLLLGRIAGGDEQRQGDQPLLVEMRISQAVGFEKKQEKKGAYPFIAVGEGMIFDDKIEEMGRLFLNAGIEVLAAEGLMDRAEERRRRPDACQ